MNSTGNGQSFDIRLTSDMLRRDAQKAIGEFQKLSQQIAREGQKIDSQFNQVGKALGNSFREGTANAKAALADLGKSIVGISALMASGTFIKDIYSSVNQFNREMKVVSTISEDVANNLGKYKDQVLGLTSQIAIAPETAAQALYQINSAGHLGADGMKVLEASAKAAVGGVTETAVAADAITTVLNAYKMKSEEAAAVSDKLFTTVRLGKTTMDELGRSIAYVAPLAATYKISIDEILAAVAQLTKQGNSTQNAMTQISASIQAVANELGDDAFKNGLLPALDEIEKRSNGSNMALKAQLSNARALRGALGLTKENAAETAEMTEIIKNSAGAAEKAFHIMNDTAGAELTKLKNNFIKEFSEMASSGTELMGTFAKALNQAFDTGHMQEFLSVLGMIIAAYGINKGILMAMSAIENNNKVSMLNAEYAAWMELLPAKEANNHADVEAAVAAGTLTEAKGAELIALREEAAQKIELARTTLETAKAELAAAEKAVAASNAKVAAAEREVEMWNRNMMAAQQYCLIEEERHAITQLGIAVENQQTAAIEANTAAERLAAAQSKVNAANKELEILSHNQNTAAQAKETASTGVLAAAKRVLTAVTAKLNAVIAANPYTLAAAAVIALGVAIYKLATYESDATKRANGMKEAVAAATTELVNEESKLAKLNKTLKESKKGSEEWLKAKNAILNQYGQYHSGLEAEIDKVGHLGKTYDELTAAIKRSIYARQMQSYADQYMPDITDLTSKLLESMEGSSTIPNYEGSGVNGKFIKLDFSQEVKEQWMKDFQRYINGEEVKFSKQQEAFLNFNWGGSMPLEHNLLYNRLRKARGDMKDYQNNLRAIGSYANVDENDINEVLNGKGKTLSRDNDGNLITNKAYWEKQRDDAKASLEAMKHTDLTSKEALALKKKITEAENALAKYETKSKKNSGSGKSLEERQRDSEQAQRDELELLKRQTRERVRAEQEAQFEVEQAQIDAMKDSAEKRLKQRDLDYRKEKAAMQKEMEDSILTEIEYQKAEFEKKEETQEKLAEAQGKKYIKKVWQDGDLMATQDAEGNSTYSADKLFEEATIGDVSTETLNKILERYQTLFASMEKVHNDTWAQAEADAMNEYLAQWGTGLEKRNALIAIADRKLEQADTEGERKGIQAQLEKDLAALDLEELKKKINWDEVFGNPGEQSLGSLEFALNNVKAAFDKNKDSLKVDEIKVYQEAIKSLENEIANRNPFTAMHKSIKDISNAKTDYINAMREAETAQTNLNLANAEALAMQERMNELDALVDSGEITKESDEYQEAQTRLGIALENRAKATQKCSEADRKVMTAQNQVVSSTRQFSNNLKNAGAVVTDMGTKARNLAKVFSDDMAASMDTALGFMDDILDASSEVINSLSEVGKKSVESVGEVTDAVSDGVEAASKTAATSISTVEKASIILTIISAALQVATAIASLFGNADDEKDKQIEALQKRIDQLQWELDNLGAFRLKNNAVDAIHVLKQSLREAKKEVKELRIGFKMNLFDYIQAQTEIYGKQVEKIAGYWANVSYTANKALGTKKYEEANDRLKNLAEQQVLIQKQIDEENGKKHTDDSKIDEYKNEIYELAQEMAEVINELMEDIIGSSAEDLAKTLGNAFFDAVAQGEDAMEAWAKTTKELVADILKNMMINEFLETRIGEIFDKYKSKWFKNGEFAGAGAVKKSADQFAADINKAGEDFQAFWESWSDSLGQWFEEDEAQREGTSQGITTASQDSVDEMNARLTTIQGHTYSISEILKATLGDVNNEIQNSLKEMLTHNVRIESVMSEIRAMQLMALDHLSVIRDNTGDMNQRLGDIDLKTKRVMDAIENIQTGGLRLKN